MLATHFIRDDIYGADSLFKEYDSEFTCAPYCQEKKSYKYGPMHQLYTERHEDICSLGTL